MHMFRDPCRKSVAAVGYAAILGFAFVTVFLFAWQRSVRVNADDLAILALSQDLSIDIGKVSDWRWCNNLYWFPDLALFFCLSRIGDNLLVGFVLFPVLAFALFVGMGTLLHRQLQPDAPKASAFTPLYALTLALLVYGQPGFVHQSMFWIGWHGGVQILGVAFLIGMIGLLRAQRARQWWAATVTMISFLSTLSDRLFLVQFAVPAAGAWMIWVARRQGRGLMALFGVPSLCLVACVAAMATQRLVARHIGLTSGATSWADYELFLGAVRALIELTPESFQRAPLNMLVGFIAMTLCAGWCIRFLRSPANRAPDALATDTDRAAWEFLALYYPASV